ncbi:LysM peptidoglycan-binding domain-containing protein [Trueperella bialowiezensis]|uniref:Muramidase-2 n=1 Tax=Trueperella bialowiezensis TaxID=312285 RepID=A0A448PC83_9ACTO|nr:LysM peptidoglycan-binding domain-containing protein [Trueperella bialowiezensis]VEI12524.1 Muramidase-2 precursor [Trueperella bialowiezensis]
MSSWIKRSGAALAAATAATIITPTAHADAVANTTQSRIPIFTSPLMTYQVKPGDTLSAIAHRTGTTVSAIAQANNLRNPNLIFPGQQLRIPGPANVSQPAPAPQPAATPAPVTQIYRVKAGDTLGKIARQHGTTVAKLAADNNIANPNIIRVGQRLTIGQAAPAPAPAATPAPAPAPAPKAAPAPQAAPAGTTYTVKAGDTLGKIARQHGTTVAKLAADNNIANRNIIRVGQRLTIGQAAPAPAPAATPAPAPAPAPKAAPAPQAAPAGTTYTVKAGDTLGKIARQHGVSVAQLSAANGISNPNRIYVGQKLTIGGATSAPAQQAAAGAPAKKQLVTNNFPGYTYPDKTVAAANENKHALISKSVPSRAEMQQMVADVARDMGVDPRLALAHAYIESGFDATAVSPANAIGTMQVIPSSGEWASDLVGRKLDLLDPYDNVVAGVAIIRQLHRAESNFDVAVAGYYQGLGGVRKYGMRPDTVNYVAKIKQAMNRF